MKLMLLSYCIKSLNKAGLLLIGIGSREGVSGKGGVAHIPGKWMQTVGDATNPSYAYCVFLRVDSSH